MAGEDKRRDERTAGGSEGKQNRLETNQLLFNKMDEAACTLVRHACVRSGKPLQHAEMLLLTQNRPTSINRVSPQDGARG